MGKVVTNIAMWVALPPLILLILAIVVPCLVLYGVFNFFRGHWLRIRFQRKWGRKGKSILFVYSESPNWQSYIEREILPVLSPHAITLNYSKRAEWKTNKPLEAKIWEQWRGDREFNPVAILIPDRGKVRTIEFFQAFRDFKHGRDLLLRQKEAELLDWVAQIKMRR
jgi:hypothetical protein